jgi:hypothetical protein
MAKLTWVTNTTTWYEYELTPEELETYENDGSFPEGFYDSGDIVREKVIEDDNVEIIYDDEDEDDFEDED